MVYPAHWYVAFGGTAYGSHEEWQCGIRMAGGDVPEGEVEGALADVAADVQKFCTSAGAMMSAQHRLTYCKLNKIGPDGNYADAGNSNTHVYSPAVAGTFAAVMIPQAAVVISLRTTAEFGRAAKGRFYWLGAGFALGSAASGDPGLNDSVLTPLATAAWTLIQDLGNWPGVEATGLAPAVVSGLGTGSWRHISGVRVDSKFDTQRRRARGIVASSISKP